MATYFFEAKKDVYLASTGEKNGYIWFRFTDNISRPNEYYTGYGRAGRYVRVIATYRSEVDVSVTSRCDYAIRIEETAEGDYHGKTVSSETGASAPVRLDGLSTTFYDEDDRFLTKVDGTNTYHYRFILYSVDGKIVDENGSDTIIIEGDVTLDLDTRRRISLTTAPNFSDEENPTITFSPLSSSSTITGQAIISADGTTEDIVRDLDATTGTYTFELTDAERQLLISKVTSGTSTNVVFRIKTFSKEYPELDGVIYSDLTKTFTISNAYPQATLEVEDINPNTLALTGDKNTIVKYYSDAAYVLNATATKGATIVSEEVVCAGKISTTETGVLEDVESNIFTFVAVDTRNNAVAGTLTKNFVDYIKLTCQQKIEIDLTGAEGTGAAATVKISGNYFRGSFGLTDNSLVVQIRHTQNDGSMGDWVTLTDFVEVYYGDGTYSLDFGISGLDYAKPYTFQCRAIDKLATAQTEEYTTRVTPVFDWSGEDFSFNVPVNINADTLDMANSTVLRHTGTNTVLSANDGHIYIRPSGTDSTSNETIFYNNGDVKFGGAVDLGDSFTIGGNVLDDFVIESGEESMGSNGTWYWRKWKSGIAECWGSRNFGNMAISTAFGSLYRSAIFSQDLPSELFKTTPEVINIQMNNGGNGCWVAKWNDVAASAVTSGSFIVINATSGNITPSQIGFNIKGFWN